MGTYMTDLWQQAIQNLSEDERTKAMGNILDQNPSDAAAGIIRQLLAGTKKPLSKAQQYVYDKEIAPALVERCSAPGCSRFTLAGEAYCDVCDIEYGNISGAA